MGEVSKVYLFSLSGNLSRCVSRLPPRQCSEPGCRALRGAQPPCRRRDRCGHPSAITAPDTAADGPAHCPPNHTPNALPFTITPTRQPTPLPTNQPSPSPSTLTVPDPHGPALSLAHHAALVPGVTPANLLAYTDIMVGSDVGSSVGCVVGKAVGNTAGTVDGGNVGKGGGRSVARSVGAGSWAVWWEGPWAGPSAAVSAGPWWAVKSAVTWAGTWGVAWAARKGSARAPTKASGSAPDVGSGVGAIVGCAVGWWGFQRACRHHNRRTYRADGSTHATAVSVIHAAAIQLAHSPLGPRRYRRDRPHRPRAHWTAHTALVTSLSIEHNQHPTALDSNCPPRGPHRSRRPSSLPHPLAYLDGLPTPSPAGPPTPLSQSLYYSHSGQLPPRT